MRMEQLLSKYETKKVHVIHKELVIGGGDCDLYLDAYIDDELVVSKKCDSMVAGFMKGLFLQMGGLNYVSGQPSIYAASTSSTGFSDRVNTVINISALSSGAGSVIRCTLSPGYVPSSSTGWVSIQGTLGSSPLVDGLYQYNRISSSQIDLVGTTYGTGYTANSASARVIVQQTSPTREPSVYTLGTPYIVVGTGTTAVALADFCLEKEMQSGTTTGRLTYNSGTVSLDTYDSTSSQVTMTRTFTNNSGATITINEIGAYACYGRLGNPSGCQWQVLIMRDLATIAVGAGKTLTVNYRIKSTFSTGTNPGGFLHHYTRFLYRHLAQASRDIIDVDNISRTQAPTTGDLKAIGNGGETPAVTYTGPYGPGYYPAWIQGIVVGRGITAVSQGDYFAETPIIHGVGTNQMLYYGGFVENFVEDVSYISFDIVKCMENKSGSAITINEIVLTGSAGQYTTADNEDGEWAKYLHTLARNVLTSGVSVPDGDMVKVIYTIKAVL